MHKYDHFIHGALEDGLHPLSPGNAAACRRTSAQLCCLAAGADVKTNRQSSGASITGLGAWTSS